MSNRKTIEKLNARDVSAAKITALADRPNDVSRFGRGGLTAAELKAWFDKYPELVNSKLRDIIEALAGADAAKFITLDGSVGGTDCLYDFLALFGPRGTDFDSHNISDYIKTLYQKEGVEEVGSYSLREIVADICLRLVSHKERYDLAITNLSIYQDDSVSDEILVDVSYADGTNSFYSFPQIPGVMIKDGAISEDKLDSEMKGRLDSLENSAVDSVSYAAATGVLTIKTNGGTEFSVDLPLELLVKSGYFDEAERDVVLVLANGDKIRIPFDAYVEKVTEELKKIDSKLPSPEGNDGRFLTAKGGKIVFSDIGESRFPKLRAPISATTDSLGMTVTVENREAPFILKNHVYIDGVRVGTTEEGEAFDFSAFVAGKFAAEVGVTAAGEGFAESDKTTARWGLTNGSMNDVTVSRGDNGELMADVRLPPFARLTVPTVINGESVYEVSLSPRDTITTGTTVYEVTFPTSVSVLSVANTLKIGMMYIPDVEVAYIGDKCEIERIYSYDTLPAEVLSSVKELSGNTANGFKRINTWCIGVGRDRGYEYAIKEDGTARLTYDDTYYGDYYEEVIPDTLGGLPVNGIGKFYKYLDNYLTSVTFGDNIEDINASAFRNCSAVTSLKFGKGLKSIGEHAFRYSGVTSLDFSGCPILETINGRAFSNCSKLASVKMSSSVTTIGSTAFASCSALKHIYVPWSEGEVAGAPWGATGAAIHYNSEV